MKLFLTSLFTFLVLLVCAAPTKVVKPTHITITASSSGGTCPQTSGPLTLRVTQPRSTAISPFLAFFDATTTTDTSITGTTTVFQDVTITWSFGDSGTSGTGTWAYGARPNTNSRNTASGGIAAHLYITSGSDTTYTATATANDGTNTVSCTVAVTAF